MKTRLALSLIAVAVVSCSLHTEAQAQGWGDVKGQVLWPDKVAIPDPVGVAFGLAACPAGLAQDRVVIDKKSRGLKNVMVWLDRPDLDGKVRPIHPLLVKPPAAKVTINQPACLFVPRITMMRTDQTLEIGNAAGMAHNTRIMFKANPGINIILQPGGAKTFEKLRPERYPVGLACDLHGWMAGRVGVFDHPYFALTDKDGKFEIKNAPAGKLVLFIQHEEFGWLHAGRAKTGQTVAIPAGGALDVGTIFVQPPKE